MQSAKTLVGARLSLLRHGSKIIHTTLSNVGHRPSTAPPAQPRHSRVTRLLTAMAVR